MNFPGDISFFVFIQIFIYITKHNLNELLSVSLKLVVAL